MMQRILLILIPFLLMGQDCKPAPPTPHPGSDYCAGNDYSVFDGIPYGWEVDGVSGAIDAVLEGKPSTDRRSTVMVRFGSSYCTGVALSENVVLTAGHCGYGATTAHDVYLPRQAVDLNGEPIFRQTTLTRQDGSVEIEQTPVLDLGEAYEVASHVVHPDYLQWVASGNTDYEARKSDLMLLHMRDPVPGPYIGLNFYASTARNLCRGVFIQGLGRWEGSGLSLREAKFLITKESDKILTSMLAPEGKGCFGDSGGPAYVDVAGQIFLAGVTSTTMSSDCYTGSNYVNVIFHKDWIIKNMSPPTASRTPGGTTFSAGG